MALSSDSGTEVLGGGGGGGGGGRHVSLYVFKQNALEIKQHINLEILLSALRERGIFSSGQLQDLANPRRNEVERVNQLLPLLARHQQRGVDIFIECLRDTATRCGGHQRILDTLEMASQDYPHQSPLLDVFDTTKDEIMKNLSFSTFLQKLVEMKEVSGNEVTDVDNPHRPKEDNTHALISLLAMRSGAQGLLKFIECLFHDPNPGHMELATILLQEADSVVRNHPRRQDIPQADKTHLMRLERWVEVGPPPDLGIQTVFRTHEAKLINELNVGAILPHLLQKKLLTDEEEVELNQLGEEEQAPRLVAMVRDKDSQMIVSFVDCLKLSKENERLHHHFSTVQAKRPSKPLTEKTDKLAVMVNMDTFLYLKNDYEAEEGHMGRYDTDFATQRGYLKTCLERMDFQTVEFTVDREGGKLSNIGARFDREVVSLCKKDAIVFFYLTGHQFPLKKKGSGERYNGAVLANGASVLSRRKEDCIDMNDLKYWVELLPTDYVTFLVDCHHSHVVSFGKQRLPSEVEIMESPWSALTGCNGVVLYFCQPDPEAMWRLRGISTEKDSVFGKLTEMFVKVLIHWMKRKAQISHRLFYEAISYHWHKGERKHPLFIPAIQGDVDRAFLGEVSYPYLQVLRADLERTNDRKFDLTKLQVATGTHLGLIKEDQLEVFHILCPEKTVSGKITKAHLLSSIAEVKEEEREKFSELLEEIYKETDTSADGSADFVMVKKTFPLHLRYSVTCHIGIADSDRETIKNYIKNNSQLLSYARNPDQARMMVVKTGQFFTVEDRDKRREEERDKRREEEITSDIKFRPRVKDIQNVKSVLEIMAWFKYVKNLRTQTDPNHFLCYLVSERPLLTKSPGDTSEHSIKASSHAESYRPSLAVLHFSDQPQFWRPSEGDTTPTMEVEFRENKVVTALELRGDPDSESHIKKADLNHKRLVFAGDYTSPSPKELKKIEVGKTVEKAWYVTIKPLDWERGTEFCVALRIMALVPQPTGKSKKQGLDNLSVMHWSFLNKTIGWTVTPQPNTDNPPRPGYGVLKLRNTDSMLQWNGRSFDPLTFDLGNEFQVDSIEMACIPGTKPLKSFRIELTKQWLSYQIKEEFSSPWPTRVDLDPPLVVSHLQLCPVLWNAGFRAQLQLHGNTHEKRVVTEEGDILHLHFVNYTKQVQFVYLYYLEETGKIEIVFSDIVQAMNKLTKFIRVHIPEGYDPVANKVTDEYRVLVSPKIIYLEPLKQLGLHEYLGVRAYNPCYIGRRTDIGKEEQWYEYKFEVVVGKGSQRHQS